MGIDPGAALLAALEATDCATKARTIEWLLAAPEIHYPENANLRDLPAPGMPAGLTLVEPRQVGRRALGSTEGRACFLHAIAHIEFNAINLALDAAYRFPGMPGEYYRDWLGVAADEARHHAMLVTRLGELGFAYGDFSAHNGLWDIARRTAHDITTRMALVPCVMEARGLDVTPGMIRRLRGVGDEPSARLLTRILAEEEAHVAVGIKWFRHFCAEAGLDPVNHYLGLLNTYLPGRVQGPFNLASRRAAGFDDEWLSRLRSMGSAATGNPVRAEPS